MNCKEHQVVKVAGIVSFMVGGAIDINQAETACGASERRYNSGMYIFTGCLGCSTGQKQEVIFFDSFVDSVAEHYISELDGLAFAASAGVTGHRASRFDS